MKFVLNAPQTSSVASQILFEFFPKVKSCFRLRLVGFISKAFIGKPAKMLTWVQRVQTLPEKTNSTSFSLEKHSYAMEQMINSPKYKGKEILEPFPLMLWLY